MALPRRHAGRGLVPVDFEIDEQDVPARPPQPVAVDAFQRRAGDDERVALAVCICDLDGDRIEPAPAVLVAQRLPAGHAADVFGRMIPVALDEAAADRRRERRADHRLSRAADPHHHDDDGALYRCRTGCLLIHRAVTGSPARGRRAAA